MFRKLLKPVSLSGSTDPHCEPLLEWKLREGKRPPSFPSAPSAASKCSAHHGRSVNDCRFCWMARALDRGLPQGWPVLPSGTRCSDELEQPSTLVNQRDPRPSVSGVVPDCYAACLRKAGLEWGLLILNPKPFVGFSRQAGKASRSPHPQELACLSSITKYSIPCGHSRGTVWLRPPALSPKPLLLRCCRWGQPGRSPAGSCPQCPGRAPGGSLTAESS